MRRYEQCAEILREHGLRRVRLMSNNPEKMRALQSGGLEIVERVPLSIKFHRSLARYLKTKRKQMGHLINLPDEFYELPKKSHWQSYLNRRLIFKANKGTNMK